MYANFTLSMLYRKENICYIQYDDRSIQNAHPLYNHTVTMSLTRHLTYTYTQSTNYVFIYPFPFFNFCSHLNYNADCNVKPMETRHKESLKQSCNTPSTCNLYNITRSTENIFYFHTAGSSSLYSLILDEQKTTANNIGMTKSPRIYES